MIPNSSDWHPPFFNSVMRDEESDRTARDRTFEYTVRDTARCTAMAYAIKADDTWLCASEKMGSITVLSPENIPPIPHLPELESQDASTLHTRIPGWNVGGGQISRRWGNGEEALEATVALFPT